MSSHDLFGVQLLNDDFTPMELVMSVLTELFGYSPEAAEEAMLITHRQGRHVIATMGKAAAEIAIAQVHDRARKAGYPLMCVLVPVGPDPASQP